MDSTSHVSQAHLDKLLLRISGNPDLKDIYDVLKGDFTLDEKLSQVLSSPKATQILEDYVEYHDFKLKKMLVDNVRYKLTLEVFGGITKIWNYYDLHFVADPEAYDERLEHLEFAQRELENKPTLLESEQKHKQKEIDSEVLKAQNNRRLFLENNEAFSGTAKVATYNGDKPVSYEITFSVPMEMALLVVQKNKELQDNYRLVLNPLISKDRYQKPKAVESEQESD